MTGPVAEWVAHALAVLVLLSPALLFVGFVVFLLWVLRRGDRRDRARVEQLRERQRDVRFWLATYNDASTPVERETARLMLIELGAWKGESDRG